MPGPPPVPAARVAPPPRLARLPPRLETGLVCRPLPLPRRSLANDVCTVDEAKSVYPLMGISANVALVVAGAFIKYANSALAHGSQLHSLRLLVSRAAPRRRPCAALLLLPLLLLLLLLPCTWCRASTLPPAARCPQVGTIMATAALMFLAKAYVDRRIIGPARAAEAAAAAASGDPEALAALAAPRAKGKKKKKAKGSIGESLEVRSPAFDLPAFAVRGRLASARPAAPAAAAGHTTAAPLLTATAAATPPALPLGHPPRCSRTRPRS
jgi:hypothetical protein